MSASKIPTLRQVPNYQALLQDYNAGKSRCPKCGMEQNFLPEAKLGGVRCQGCGVNYFQPSPLGEYMLYGNCGQGGMGSVYKAVSARFPNRELAVKVLSRSGRNMPGNITAILNEGRVAKHFSESDFVAGCLDSGFIDGEYFTVMPLVEGEELGKMVKRLGRLPEREVLQIALHILAAEQHIYRQGYLFRDLKPENIIINHFGYAILLDFGLCQSTEMAAHPNTDEFVTGSPYYLPPERLLGKAENRASEIYSLGMVMFFSITGRTFYESNELESLVQRHVSGLRINGSAKMEGIRKPVADIISKMVMMEPSERYQTYESAANDILAVLQ